MANAKTEVSMPADREVVVTRSFDAPRKLVFDAYTKPELVKRWLYHQDDWPMVECRIDFRVGGAYRYVWRNKDRGDLGLSGLFREIKAPERLVHTERFDMDPAGGEAVVTTLFEEKGGRTTVRATVLSPSKEARDAALKSGMLDGWAQCLDRLEKLLPTLR